MDTVQDVRRGEGTGISFRGATVEAVQGALQRAMELYQSKQTFLEVQRRGMRTDFSWDASAARYEAVYAELAERR